MSRRVVCSALGEGVYAKSLSSKPFVDRFSTARQAVLTIQAIALHAMSMHVGQALLEGHGTMIMREGAYH